MRNFVKTDWSLYLTNNFQSPMTREDERESRRFLRTRLWLCTSHGDRFDIGMLKMQLTKLGNVELYRQESVGRRVLSFSLLIGILRVWLANLASKKCNLRERRSVENHACFQQWHDHARCAYLHSCLQYTVLIKCSIYSDLLWMRTLREWLKKKIHGIWHIVTLIHHMYTFFESETSMVVRWFGAFDAFDSARQDGIVYCT